MEEFFEESLEGLELKLSFPMLLPPLLLSLPDGMERGELGLSSFLRGKSASMEIPSLVVGLGLFFLCIIINIRSILVSSPI